MDTLGKFEQTLGANWQAYFEERTHVQNLKDGEVINNYKLKFNPWSPPCSEKVNETFKLTKN
jgi:hypothetical protein